MLDFFQMMKKTVIRLKKRRDFVHLNNNGQKVITKGFVLLALSRKENNPFSDMIRVGFTTTKRLGNAVVRNRIRRRLRAVAAHVIPAFGKEGYDYILIGRLTTNACSFKRLLSDLETTLGQV